MEEKKVLTVAELTLAIKACLEPRFKSLYVKGEISNLKKQSSGHLYFSLKDADAQLSCALFKGNTFSLEREPKDGDQVILKGDLSVYPPRGNYQMIVRELQYQGTGELLLKLHQLKKTLQERGWFKEERKKKLPKIPKKIGVITSPTGAVIQDILNVLSRRFNQFHLILNPVKVQGEGAAEEIAQAIYDFNQHRLVDVMIVGRGGGSLEDLWAFNEERVAKAIFESKIPVISAVGHETDFSLADFVADVRAPTPSAAAEIVTAAKQELLSSLGSLSRSIHKALSSEITHFKTSLKQIKKQPLFLSSYYLLAKPIQQIDDTRESLEESMRLFLERKRALLSSYKNQIKALSPISQLLLAREKSHQCFEKITAQTKHALKLHRQSLRKEEKRLSLDLFFKGLLKNHKENLKKMISHLRSLDPKNLLKKGYSILFSEKENSIILSVDQVKENDLFVALLSDGKCRGTFHKIEKSHERK